MPEPDKFVESSENSLSLHLEGWQDTNCPTVYFMVEQRWSLISSGFRWINVEGTLIDVKSDKLFFFDEAEGTNHSLTIRNLDFETTYEVIIEVFSPYGSSTLEDWHTVATPPGSCIKVPMHLSFQPKFCRAMPGRICA